VECQANQLLLKKIIKIYCKIYNILVTLQLNNKKLKFKKMKKLIALIAIVGLVSCGTETASVEQSQNDSTSLSTDSVNTDTTTTEDTSVAQ
jgi:hypothetical protein